MAIGCKYLKHFLFLIFFYARWLQPWYNLHGCPGVYKINVFLFSILLLLHLPVIIVWNEVERIMYLSYVLVGNRETQSSFGHEWVTLVCMLHLHIYISSVINYTSSYWHLFSKVYAWEWRFFCVKEGAQLTSSVKRRQIPGTHYPSPRRLPAV